MRYEKDGRGRRRRAWKNAERKISTCAGGELFLRCQEAALLAPYRGYTIVCNGLKVIEEY